jgi:hypothetical protein
MMLQNLALMAEAMGLGGFPHWAAHAYGWFEALGCRMGRMAGTRYMGVNPVLGRLAGVLGRDVEVPYVHGFETSIGESPIAATAGAGTAAPSSAGPSSRANPGAPSNADPGAQSKAGPGTPADAGPGRSPSATPGTPLAGGSDTDCLPLLTPFCPPYYPSMEAAVRAVVALKFGPEGTFRGGARWSAWQDPAAIQRDAQPPSEATVNATIACCEYIYRQYGRFPAYSPPLRTVLGFQATHLDLEFYDKHYKPEAVSDTVRTHFTDWHPATPDES